MSLKTELIPRRSNRLRRETDKSAIFFPPNFYRQSRDRARALSSFSLRLWVFCCNLSFTTDGPVHLALVLTNSLYNFLTITDSSKTFLHLGNRKLDRFARQDILSYLPWTGQASCNKQRICGRFRYWANHLTKNLILQISSEIVHQQ